MDDVYENLDNFTDENTIAELREENNDLKIRLEEYAVKLDQLQREFDMLTSEHKKLEINYSSLLKTAKSEIERKTEIITKLNIEKDTMVLNSIQNRNTFNNRRNTPKNRPVKNYEEARFGNSTQFSGDKSARPSFPSQGSKERREDDFRSSYPSSNTSAPRNIQTKLLDNANKAEGNLDLKSPRNNQTKENIGLKNASKVAGARISNRRKSMPVFSMEKFSSDEEEVISTGSFKECVTKEQPESRCLDPWDPSIDTPIMDVKSISHQKYSSENRSRHTQYDSEKNRSRNRHETLKKYRRNYSPDRGRRRSHDRRKGSPDRRRSSLEKYIKESHDHGDAFYKRQEYDRRRRLVSPPKDKYHDYKQRNRDSPRSSERNHPPYFDRYKSRNQDMYPMKHKMLPDYEQSSKRMRLDSFPKHEEERLRIERQVGHLPLDLDQMHGMSCQSPDQTHLETLQSHQTREIKLYASSKLDDPRLVSKKYALKTHDGKTELSTVESANIDVKVIDTSNWEMIKKMRMPDALLRKPMNSDMPSALFQRPSTSAMPDVSLRKSYSPDIPDPPIQKFNSSDCLPCDEIEMSNAVTTSMPEISLQKPKSLKSCNILETHVQKPYLHTSNYPSTQKPISTDMPDILIQNTSEEMMSEINLNYASTQNSTFTDDLDKRIYRDSGNQIPNISMDSGKIYDFQNDFHDPQEEPGEINTHKKSCTNQPTTQHMAEPQSTENICLKSSNYKIFKIDHNDAQIRNDLRAFDDHNDNLKLIIKRTGNIDDSHNPFGDIEDKNHTKVCRQNESKISKRRRSDFQDYVTAKEIIEGDLELSDENSDNADVQIIKQTQGSGHNSHHVSEMKDERLFTSKKPDLDRINLLKFDFDETSIEKVKEPNIKGENTETTVTDTRKSKARKKPLKLKDTKEPHVKKDTTVSKDKHVQKKVNNTTELLVDNDISLSMDQLVDIKESITKALSEDKDFPLSKSVKKKDNKSKTIAKNKDTTIDKTIQKKDTNSKELSENIDNVPINKSLKKKEYKPKQLLKKGTIAIDKPVKNKEINTKESQEPCNTQILKKLLENKKTKSSENTEHAATIEKQDKKKEYKTKETKFNELFGDSSSLVSPEDLGLVPTVVIPPENYVALFEDAQDATDVSTDILPATEKINDTARKDSTLSNFKINAKITETPATIVEPAYQPTQKSSADILSYTEKTNDTFCKEAKLSNFRTNAENTETPTTMVEPAHQNTQNPMNMVTVPAEATINQTIYQNLQPQISPKDKNVVKTVIISTGIQPQHVLDANTLCPFENDKADADLHVMQCVKPTVLHDIALQALATSTPQKVWQQNVVQAEIDPKLNNSRCSNQSKKTCIDKNRATVHSDTTNTSQTNEPDEPDVTIFVKRRRKVVKKKI